MTAQCVFISLISENNSYSNVIKEFCHVKKNKWVLFKTLLTCEPDKYMYNVCIPISWYPHTLIGSQSSHTFHQVIVPWRPAGGNHGAWREYCWEDTQVEVVSANWKFLIQRDQDILAPSYCDCDTQQVSERKREGMEVFLKIKKLALVFATIESKSFPSTDSQAWMPTVREKMVVIIYNVIFYIVLFIFVNELCRPSWKSSLLSFYECFWLIK